MTPVLRYQFEVLEQAQNSSCSMLTGYSWAVQHDDWGSRLWQTCQNTPESNPCKFLPSQLNPSHFSPTFWWEMVFHTRVTYVVCVNQSNTLRDKIRTQLSVIDESHDSCRGSIHVPYVLYNSLRNPRRPSSPKSAHRDRLCRNFLGSYPFDLHLFRGPKLFKQRMKHCVHVMQPGGKQSNCCH